MIHISIYILPYTWQIDQSSIYNWQNILHINLVLLTLPATHDKLIWCLYFSWYMPHKSSIYTYYTLPTNWTFNLNLIHDTWNTKLLINSQYHLPNTAEMCVGQSPARQMTEYLTPASMHTTGTSFLLTSPPKDKALIIVN